MYARCGHMNEAQFVFDGLLSKNEVSWNALIAGHARKGEGENALFLFSKMQSEDFKLAYFNYSNIFTACASTGSLEQGKWVHPHIIKSAGKLIAFIGNTLLDMYAKSGRIEHGLGKEAMEHFEEMPRIGIEPNVVTFLCVLTACGHAGLLNKGQYYFELMKKFKVEMEVAHYVTVVDLLGRSAWSSRWSDAVKVRKMMKESGVKKEPACSWVEIVNVSNMFVVDDDVHPQRLDIHKMWEKISGKLRKLVRDHAKTNVEADEGSGVCPSYQRTRRLEASLAQKHDHADHHLYKRGLACHLEKTSKEERAAVGSAVACTVTPVMEKPCLQQLQIHFRMEWEIRQ
ncbi:hypothetical protein F0562_026060 [Nyssa sinensis]|uniref:Pentatricopeptide repeat-containing protein n=1 Tax=Nyssa sinensis TaxID=561372 RepID=A0A5J5B9S9_9ASTE|nr:hypothetical protein F0562_026060 [Nyssa sinensis]